MTVRRSRPFSVDCASRTDRVVAAHVVANIFEENKAFGMHYGILIGVEGDSVSQPHLALPSVVSGRAVLQGVRVLEISSDVSGAYAGRLLAALGASVTRYGPRSDPASADERTVLTDEWLHCGKAVADTGVPPYPAIATVASADFIVVETISANPDWVKWASRLMRVAEAMSTPPIIVRIDGDPIENHARSATQSLGAFADGAYGAAAGLAALLAAPSDPELRRVEVSARHLFTHRRRAVVGGSESPDPRSEPQSVGLRAASKFEGKRTPHSPFRDFLTLCTETIGIRSVAVPWRLHESSTAEGGRRLWSIAGDGSLPAKLLEGLRVLSLNSGPLDLLTDLLESLGAEVIELTDDDPAAHSGHHTRAHVRNVVLDVERERGRTLLLDLVERCDIVTDNSDVTRRARHLPSYADFVERNPSVVMLSMSMTGQRGSLKTSESVDDLAAAMTRIGALSPTMGDPNAVGHGLTVLFAVLLQRRSTGRGAWIALSQIEALMCVLPTHVIEAQIGQYVSNSKVSSYQMSDLWDGPHIETSTLSNGAKPTRSRLNESGDMVRVPWEFGNPNTVRAYENLKQDTPNSDVLQDLLELDPDELAQLRATGVVR